MKTKPAGPKFRNLFARGGVIYYESKIGGERIKFSTKSADWNEAAAVRDLWLLRRATEQPKREGAPLFAEMAERYLREATRHLAATTREDREKLLGKGKRLATYFDSMPADEVTRATLVEWWHAEVEGRGRSEKTGMQYLAALSGVFGYAVDLEILEANPVDALRGTLRRRRRTKGGRAAERVEKRKPIETPEQLLAFALASRAGYDRIEGGRAVRLRQLGHVADLLQLDGGLRLGEALGLRWRDVRYGDGTDDTTRCLEVREAIARGRHEGAPKSGRARTVALSRRLRALLREWYIASGRPAQGARVLAGLEDYPYRTLHFEKVIAAAAIPRHTPKDLRDTFASQLLTAGVQLGWISEQLGHSDAATTARHYARWTGGKAYRRPLDLLTGEVPPDMLARIEALDSHHVSHHVSHHGDAAGA